MHPNTAFIINWTDRMVKRTNFCGAVFPEVLAHFMGETDQETPSDAAEGSLNRQWYARERIEKCFIGAAAH